MSLKNAAELKSIDARQHQVQQEQSRPMLLGLYYHVFSSSRHRSVNPAFVRWKQISRAISSSSSTKTITTGVVASVIDSHDNA